MRQRCMYEVCVEAGFSATHQVWLPSGEIEPPHNHPWKAEAVFRGRELDEHGMLIDFIKAQDALRSVVAVLHNAHLNEVSALGGRVPTAEHVAQWIFGALQRRLGDHHTLAGVRVHEAPGCVAGYWESSA